MQGLSEDENGQQTSSEKVPPKVPFSRRNEKPPKRRITMKTEHAHGEGAVYQTAEGI